MKIVLALFALFSSLAGYTQSRTLNGLILDEEMAPLCNVGVYINDWDKVGETCSNGKYAIIITVGIDSIIFRSVG